MKVFKECDTSCSLFPRITPNELDLANKTESSRILKERG
jgi:hypothetical protein